MTETDANRELRVLILEDTPTDAELMEHELRKAGMVFTAQRVDTQEAFLRALNEFHPDVILSDYKLPAFDGKAALTMERREHPEIPVVMVTGALPDMEAVELLNAGAKDYVLKDRLARLAPAVRRVLSAEKGIRARKAAEKALRESEAKYRALVEASSDWIWEFDEDGVYTYSSPQVYQVLGRAAEDILGRSPLELMQPDEAARLKETFNTLVREKKPFSLLEHADLHQNGRLVYLESSGVPVLDGQGVFRGYRGVSRDITERKEAEKELRRLNHALRALSAGNHALVHSETEQSLLESMCHAVTDAGYARAWVGYALQDDRKGVAPMAIACGGKTDIEALRINWDEQASGSGPTAMAMQTGQTQLAGNTQREYGKELQPKTRVESGYASCIALPLKDKDEVIGVLTIYATEPAAFGADQVLLLEEMANDLAFGIVNMRTRGERDRAVEERQHYADRLRASLEETLGAISATVDMRDPYTAGHQRLVAQLAVAIAREMALPEEQIHGIYLASLVHDLGKISIPAEMLSRPGTLSDIEMSIIRTHPQAGYEALKGVEFPWPIAAIVWQHHERMDGSGYPQGLKDGEILLEARIVAVADVVVSINTHRPYRPSRGLDAALQEISTHRGTLYDPDVVDASIRLFREKKFVFT